VCPKGTLNLRARRGLLGRGPLLNLRPMQRQQRRRRAPQPPRKRTTAIRTPDGKIWDCVGRKQRKKRARGRKKGAGQQVLSDLRPHARVGGTDFEESVKWTPGIGGDVWVPGPSIEKVRNRERAPGDTRAYKFRGKLDYGPYHPVPAAVPAPACTFLVKDGDSKANSDMTMNTGAVMQEVINVPWPWASTVVNGSPPSLGEPRYADPFTMRATSLTCVANTQSFTSASCSSNSSTATYDWTVYGHFEGSGKYTYTKGPAPSTNSYQYDWKFADHTVYDGGICSTILYSRPNGCILHIKPVLVGQEHVCHLFCFPVLPWAYTELTSANPTGWPTTAGTHLNSAQVSWGGREFALEPNTQGVRLVTLPCDARSFDFIGSNSARLGIDATYAQAWGGWIWWITGLSSSDTVDVTSIMTEEVMPMTSGSTAYTNASSIRTTNAALRDGESNMLERMVSAGMSAYAMVEKLAKFALKQFVEYDPITGAEHDWNERGRNHGHQPEALEPMMAAFTGHFAGRMAPTLPPEVCTTLQVPDSLHFERLHIQPEQDYVDVEEKEAAPRKRNPAERAAASARRPTLPAALAPS